MSVLNIAFYKFVTLSEGQLLALKPALLAEATSAGLGGTILIAPEGINGFLAGDTDALENFLTKVQAREEIGVLELKRSYSEKIPFARTLVKIKKEIIAFGAGPSPAEKPAPRVQAQDLARWLQNGRDDEGREVVVLDTRNEYETKLGKFENAVDLKLQTFRQFPERVKEWRDSDPQLRAKTIVSYCTGGIRCEKAAPLLLEYGFEHVYQLDGGILKYFENEGQKNYDGDCFVFDYRVAVDSELAPTGAILCYACQIPLTIEEQAHPDYVKNVSCPNCAGKPKLHKEKIAQNIRAAASLANS